MKNVIAYLLLLLSNLFIQSVLCLPAESAMSINTCAQNIQNMPSNYDCSGVVYSYDYSTNSWTVSAPANKYPIFYYNWGWPAQTEVDGPCGGTITVPQLGGYEGICALLCSTSQVAIECQTDLTPVTNTIGKSCQIAVQFGSTANLGSGNLYHSQDVASVAFSYNSADS